MSEQDLRVIEGEAIPLIHDCLKRLGIYYDGGDGGIVSCTGILWDHLCVPLLDAALASERARSQRLQEALETIEPDDLRWAEQAARSPARRARFARALAALASLEENTEP